MGSVVKREYKPHLLESLPGCSRHNSVVALLLQEGLYVGAW